MGVSAQEKKNISQHPWGDNTKAVAQSAWVIIKEAVQRAVYRRVKRAAAQ